MSFGFTYPDWMLEGACRDLDKKYMDTIFFPEAFTPSKEAEAKAVCAECPVREECLQHALEHGSPGIWGGTTVGERRDILNGTA